MVPRLRRPIAIAGDRASIKLFRVGRPAQRLVGGRHRIFYPPPRRIGRAKRVQNTQGRVVLVHRQQRAAEQIAAVRLTSGAGLGKQRLGIGKFSAFQ